MHLPAIKLLSSCFSARFEVMAAAGPRQAELRSPSAPTRCVGEIPQVTPELSPCPRLCATVNSDLLKSILNTPDKTMDAAAGGKELVSSWKATFNTHKVLSLWYQ